MSTALNKNMPLGNFRVLKIPFTKEITDVHTKSGNER